MAIRWLNGDRGKAALNKIVKRFYLTERGGDGKIKVSERGFIDMKTINREVAMKKLLTVLLMGLFVFSGIFFNFLPQACSEEYPSQDIRWVVGAKPGGGVDLYARAIGRYMEKYMPEGVHVIVENRPGAGHSIANNVVYNAKPDGYTMGMPFMPGLYLMQLLQETTFDMKKMNWLGMIVHDPRSFTIASSSKFKTLKDLQEAESVGVGIVGAASEAGVMITCKELGINAKYVAGHKNSKEAVLAAIRGDVDVVGFTYNSLRSFIDKKQLIPVATLGSQKRLKALPDVPTMGELGFPALNRIQGNWRVISATPGVPEDRLARLQDIVWKTFHDEELLAWSKSAKRPIEPLNAAETKEIMDQLMAQMPAYKDLFREYMK